RGGLETAAVSSALRNQLVALGRREGVTLFMTLLAAFQALLARYAGQKDVIVGSTIAGRNRAETEGLIGFFINTLALRTDLSGNPTFRELLRRVKETAVGAFAHQDLPFERLVEELQPERDIGHTPWFRVMFQFKTAEGAPPAMSGLALEHLPTSTHSSKFDVMLTAIDAEGALTLLMEYSAALFAPATIERMLGHYTTLLQHLADAPDQRIAALALMTKADEHRLVHEWNQTQAEFPRERCIHELFEAQAERAPGRVAVIAGDEQITCDDLNARANQLARHLRARGIGPEVRVAICVERSIDMVVGLLGVLKAGGAYVPLEPSYPPDRLGFVLRDSEARVVVTSQRLAGTLEATGIPAICLDRDWPGISRESAANVAGGATAGNLAHVIYTSGSTGRPKGVASAHRASVNRLAWMWEAYPFGEDEVCCQKTSLSFVDAIAEIFSPLLGGAPLVMIPDEVVKEPSALVEFLSDHRVTRLVLVPSLLDVLLKSESLGAKLRCLRYCVCSGETLPVALAAAFREKLPGAILLNLYGSSEVAADVTSSVVDSTDETSSVAVGRPIANTRVYLLDEQLSPVPVGVPGEIYIGGEGLARGYLHLPELTAQAFIPDPFGSRPGERLFKTGDLGRYRSSGSIEYRGRRDHQVKLRGFRIELGEIETALKTHPGVQDAVVIARDDRGDKYLVAYIVPVDDSPSTSQLREHLRRSLPDYMVPSAFVRLDALPLTASGKVNRLALPPFDRGQLPREHQVLPRTPTEEILSGIWGDLLHVDRVGAHDDFFALGGHSLLLAGVAARVRAAFDLELPLRDLFETPTIAALAGKIDQRLAAPEAALGTPLRPIARDGMLPLSFGQERLWFADQLDPASAAYNIPRLIRLIGALDLAALQRGLDAIAERHEILRARVLHDNGRPALSIGESVDVTMRLFDVRGAAAHHGADEARRFWIRETQRPFDLSCAPLFRVALVRLGDQEHVLVVTMHHIVSDAWSIGVFLRELVGFYNGFSTGQDVSLPALTVQYADYAAWQRQWLGGDALRAQLAYWQAQLEGAPEVIGLPLDRARPEQRSAHGARQALSIPAAVAHPLKALGRASSVTLFMTLLGAFQSLLACLSGEDDVVVGSPVAGRNRPEIEPLIGNFVNTLVLRTRLSGDPTFREILRRTRAVSLGAFANQDVPFEKLVEELKPQRSLSYHPLFQVWFVLQNASVDREAWRGLAVDSLQVDNRTTRHDLQLTLWEASEGLEGAFIYRTDLFSAETIACIAEQFTALASLVAGDPDVRLSAMRRALDEVRSDFHERATERLEQASLATLRSSGRKVITHERQRIAE
ncbi:MAG: amino acid adenylation domain-containing protein, partial [Acidobacteriota bacterium]